MFQINQQQQTWVKDKYANTLNKKVVAIEFSRRREQETSDARTLLGELCWTIKWQERDFEQSALCEVACEQ